VSTDGLYQRGVQARLFGGGILVLWEEQLLGKIIWVGIGGAVGAILRYSVSGYVQSQIKIGTFPLGTLAVNVLGCFLLGFLSQVVAGSGRLPSEGALFLLVGMLGAFTTFSTFSKEAVDLLTHGQITAALVDIAVHVVLGLTAVGGGYELGRVLQR